MKPLSFTVVCVARYHLTIADAVAIAVQGLIGVDVPFVVAAVATAIRIFVYDPCGYRMLRCTLFVASLRRCRHGVSCRSRPWRSIWKAAYSRG